VARPPGNPMPSGTEAAGKARAPMMCPFCGFREDKVIDSRESKEGDSIRRRRQCLSCERRYTTYERCDEVPYMVIKKDGRREKFDRQKVLNGLLRASEKRPISMGTLAQLVDEVESLLLENSEREIPTTLVGEHLMDRLKSLDKIAYVRFASVYRDFKDVQEFLDELKNMAPAIQS
jgi:transcriptional repressor NrdR